MRSALEQTVPFDEIILVDDGSTDDSIEIIEKEFSEEVSEGKIQLILKDNEGQLSCFNEAFKASEGDIICFLDSDDVYEKNYVEVIKNFYLSNNKCDFLFCACKEFGEEIKEKITRSFNKDKEFGITKTLTLCSFYPWIGAATSTVSVKREILEKILPVPVNLLPDWKSRADDCLIFGASVAGARKYYINNALVNYRIHGNNSFAKKKFTREYKNQRKKILFKFFGFLLEKALDKNNKDDKDLKEAALLHLKTRFGEIKFHERFFMFFEKLKYLRAVKNAQRKDDLDLAFGKKIFRACLLDLCYLFGLKGSFIKFI